jgi:hypothetical protein
MSTNMPETDWTSLPASEWVLRLSVKSKDFQITRKVSPEAFALSTQEKRDSHPRLSVWSQTLTTPVQAWEIMGSKPVYELVLRLEVETIRSIQPNPKEPVFPQMDVVWHTLYVLQGDSRVLDSRPGSKGHAGITGLEETPSLKMQRKSLRSQLADKSIVHELNLELG